MMAEVWEGQIWRFLGFQGNCNYLPAIELAFLEISGPHPHFPNAMRVKASFRSLTLLTPLRIFFFLLLLLKNEVVTRKDLG